MNKNVTDTSFLLNIRKRNKKLIEYLDAMYAEADAETDAQMYNAIKESMEHSRT